MVNRHSTPHSATDLQFCLDLSHHPWTRKPVLASVDTMQQAAERTIQMIEAADNAGLDSVWVSEDPDGWDAFGVLAAAARTTKQIRLGTGVTNPYLRHPNLMAMSISTLDRLSGGRAFLGLGRGQPEWYRHALGVAGTSPLKQLETAFELLRQWSRPPYRASSESDPEVNDWARAIWPTREHVPIYLAALGPLALDLAARKADGLLLSDFCSLPFLEKLIPEMRAKIAGYGRDPDAFDFYLRTGIKITDDPADDLRYRKSLMAVLTPLPGMSQQIEHPEYDVEAIIDAVAEAMGTREVLEQGGNFVDVRRQADFAAAREAIPDGLIEDLSMIGNAGAVREKLNQLAEIGITHVFLAPPDAPDAAYFSRTVEELTAG